MKTEQAIKLLHRLQDEQFDGIHGDERREALEMAVRALFSQQTVNDSQELVNDCISRKALMKEFSDFVRKSNNSDFAPTPTWNDAVSLVGSMPSAQPQVCDDAISRDDAIMAVKTGALSAATIFGRTDEGATAYYETVKAIKALPSAQPEKRTDKRTETHACDCISRQEAIDSLRTCYDTEAVTYTNGNEYISYDQALELIEKLPSAQPEIIRCKDCRHNHDCNIQYHAQAGEEFYCGVAERRIDGKNQN